MRVKLRVRNLELIRENNILLDHLQGLFQFHCRKLDGKYTHNENPLYKALQALLISKGRIKSSDCELK